RRADEDCAREVESEEDGGGVAAYPRDDHANESDDTVTYIENIPDVELKTDDEEEDDRPEVRQTLNEVRVGDQAEHARSDQNPHENGPDRRRLIDSGCHQVAGESEKEKEAHLDLNC